MGLVMASRSWSRVCCIEVRLAPTDAVTELGASGVLNIPASMQNSISDEFFGSLTWDALVDRWSGEMEFPGGHRVRIMIGTPDGENDQAITPEAREACQRIMMQQAAFARKAAEDLLGIHNEGWHHVEETPPLTTDQFEARLTLDSVYLESWGSAAVYFDDRDLFWGHVIRVEQDADGSFPCEAIFEG